MSIFAMLGLEVFGAHFDRGHGLGDDDLQRANFDNFYQSLLTVFQVDRRWVPRCCFLCRTLDVICCAAVPVSGAVHFL